MRKRLIATLAALTCCLYASASHRPDSTGTVPKPVHYVGADFGAAYILPSNAFFRGANATGAPMTYDFSAHLKYGFRFSPESRLGRDYPYAIQGIGVAYDSFANPAEIGRPVSVYVFQTSRIAALGDRLSFDYEWNFGASFGWKKHDYDTNPNNVVVGSRANAYINLTLLLNWRIADSWNLRAGAGFSHFSNGNTSIPNAGVNTAGVRLGLSRSFGEERRTAPQAGGGGAFQREVSYDIILYGALKKKGFKIGEDAYVAQGRFAVAGLSFNPLYSFSRSFKAGLSLDACFDESANIRDHIANDRLDPDIYLKFHRPPFREQFSLGLSVRAEVAMPIFSVNLGIGRNFICKGADTDGFYQTFVLKTMLGRKLFLHVGYRLYEFRQPDHLMLGIGVRL